VKVLLTGGGGQLGRALAATVPSEVQLRSVSRTECDITELSIVEQVIGNFRPNVVINCAAYTAVDAAEENEELAFRVNGIGAGNVAKGADRVGARVIHISTDYVFDGRRSTPYPPDAPTNPLNVYGASKLKGEELVSAATPRATIVRAGWLYSHSGKNFLVSILAALRGTRPLLVVSDEHGCPTSAHEFAVAIWKTARLDLRGIFHWANLGSATRYEFAQEIKQIAQQLGLLREDPELRQVTAAEYARLAKRPTYSVLDSTELAQALDLSPSPWRQGLRTEMMRIAEKTGAVGRPVTD
jgi:dTDP-4-dehydrorhamnose reductase